MNEFEYLERVLEHQKHDAMERELYKLAGEIAKINHVLGDTMGLNEDNCSLAIRAFEEPLEQLNRYMNIWKEHLVKMEEFELSLSKSSTSKK